MQIAKWAAAAALAGSAVAAMADTTPWAGHDGVEFGLGFGVGSGTAVLDTYSFALGATSTLVTTAVSNESSALDLSGATVFLYKGEVGSGTFVSGFGFDSSSVTASITPLTAGLYYYLVSATVGSGAVAGSYTLTSQALPVALVPEPESYALMLAGLAIVGFISSRRRSDLNH
ncbi:MAG: FxDxF family PEP-CTERM protein [Rubrivivax sp.]